MGECAVQVRKSLEDKRSGTYRKALWFRTGVLSCSFSALEFSVTGRLRMPNRVFSERIRSRAVRKINCSNFGTLTLRRVTTAPPYETNSALCWTGVI